LQVFSEFQEKEGGMPQHKTTKARRDPKLIQEKIRLEKLKVFEAEPFLFMYVKKQIK
jgi:hypothetical protein